MLIRHTETKGLITLCNKEGIAKQCIGKAAAQETRKASEWPAIVQWQTSAIDPHRSDQIWIILYISYAHGIKTGFAQHLFVFRRVNAKWRRMLNTRSKDVRCNATTTVSYGCTHTELVVIILALHHCSATTGITLIDQLGSRKRNVSAAAHPTASSIGLLGRDECLIY